MALRSSRVVKSAVAAVKKVPRKWKIIGAGGLAAGTLTFGVFISSNNAQVGGGGGGGGPLSANVFVGAAGSCTRSGSAVVYNASTSCSTFQSACNAATAGDTVGVEPGTYTKVVLTTCGNNASGPMITFKPDNGVVTFVGIQGASWDGYYGSTGLMFGQVHAHENSTAAPPYWLTFDGGAAKNFHTGTSTLPGEVLFGCCDTNSAAAADHITVTNFIICDACPESGTTVGFSYNTNVVLSNSQLGPVCCGETCNPTCASSTTDFSSPALIGGGGGSAGTANGITITGNTLLGVTNTTTVWPAALGTAPQNTCSSCHDDCVHLDGTTWNIVITSNVMYNCYAQGIFIEDDIGSGVNNVTIENNFVDEPPGTGAIGAQINAKPDTRAQGTWIFAFNTTDGQIGMTRTGTAVGFSLTVIGNYGFYGFHDDAGNNAFCSWTPQNGTYTQDYNMWYTNSAGANTPCGAHDANTAATSLNVVDANSWPSNDLNTNFNLANDSTVASNFVPAATCATYVSTDIHGTARPGSGFCDAGAYEAG